MSNWIKYFYEFGSFKLDASQRVLMRENAPLPLTLKSVEILLALVENGNRIVEKEELMKRVWPDTFVEEANLTQHISLLRKTLGDNAQAPRFIETVPRRGYRFIADVQEVTIEEQTQTRLVIEETTQESAATSLSSLWIIAPRISRAIERGWQQARYSLPFPLISIGILALAAVGFGWQAFFRTSSMPQRPLDFVRLIGSKVGEGGTLLGARFAPKDKRIAYASDGKDGLNIWIIQYEQVGDPRPLQVTDGAWHDESPIWSPDGERIAFVSDRGEQVGIWSIPAFGGTPILIKTIQEGRAAIKNGGPALKHWSRDGTTIYYQQDNNFFALNVASKAITRITTFEDPTRFPRDFCLSADEQKLAYVEERNGQLDLWLLPVAGGQPRQLTHDAAVERFPAWHPDNQRLIYSLVRDDQLHLYAASIDGREPRPVPAGDKQGLVADISADGTRVLCLVQQDECDLVRVSVDSGEESDVTSEIGMEFWPAPSHDGTKVAYQSNQGIWRPKRSALLTRPLAPDGRASRIAENAFELQWSPDGERVAFLRNSDRINNLWTVRAAGGEEKQITMGGVIFGGYTSGPAYSRFETVDFSWSPSGSHIAYCSKQGGAANLWVVARDGSGALQITTNFDRAVQCTSPIWSSNGLHIAYLSAPSELAPPDRQTWRVYVTDLKTSRTVRESQAMLRLLGWTAEGGLVIAAAENEGMNRAVPTRLQLSTLSADGAMKRQFEALESGYLASFYLSPDGRTVSGVTAQQGKDNLWLWPMDGGKGRRLTNNADKKIYFSTHAWSPDGKWIYYGRQTRLISLTMADKFR